MPFEPLWGETKAVPSGIGYLLFKKKKRGSLPSEIPRFLSFLQ
jgi:hypothetical protein